MKLNLGSFSGAVRAPSLQCKCGQDKKHLGGNKVVSLKYHDISAQTTLSSEWQENHIPSANAEKIESKPHPRIVGFI